jgi:alkylation response protein AidB-like acyl-CoA dehydrogenase
MTVAGSYFPAESIDHDLVEQAAALQPLLAASASRCENQRRIPDENLAALDAAELFSTMVPKRVGGHGAKLATQLAVSAELARGCASTAWVQTLLNVGTWAASLLVTEGQSDVFTDGRPPRVCGVLTPTGTARPTDGGYLVNGRWGFASGSLHADWCTGGVIVLDDDGNEVGQDVAYMPIGEVTIEDTWYVAGMRGTGSNTLVASDIFVPTHRFALTGHVSGTPTPLADQEPSDRWPLGAVLALVLLGPILGIAAAALDTVTTKAEKRAISYTTYARQTDSSVVLANLARASLDIDTARLHAFRAAADIAAAGTGGDLDPVALGRLRGACGYVCETLRRAMDCLVNIGGASSFADNSALQRNWRDLNVASRHAFLATDPVHEVYGRALFDLDQIVTIL